MSPFHNMDSPLMDPLPMLTILRCMVLDFLISMEFFMIIQERQSLIDSRSPSQNMRFTIQTRVLHPPGAIPKPV
ncbi:hypothetical protein AX14_013536 [Amanita brunnescens Koide BX004]|nr:hypothetical protein AX14_013536 [Amanita brunnescens Koide BX004]